MGPHGAVQHRLQKCVLKKGRWCESAHHLPHTRFQTAFALSNRSLETWTLLGYGGGEF
jgi:hypothetical protein